MNFTGKTMFDDSGTPILPPKRKMNKGWIFLLLAGFIAICAVITTGTPKTPAISPPPPAKSAPATVLPISPPPPAKSAPVTTPAEKLGVFLEKPFKDTTNWEFNGYMAIACFLAVSGKLNNDRALKEETFRNIAQIRLEVEHRRELEGHSKAYQWTDIYAEHMKSHLKTKDQDECVRAAEKVAAFLEKNKMYNSVRPEVKK